MELPIQLKFFKKLELYQELCFQNKKVQEAQLQNQRAWRTEKEILKWTTWNHHHLGTPIGEGYIKRILPTQVSDEQWDITTAMRNLTERKFAYFSGDEIKFTETGLIMGEVINDIEGDSIWGNWKYPLLLATTWITAIVGALSVIINFFKMLNI